MGAWDYGAFRYGWKPVDARSTAALLAVKQALIDNGYAKGIVLDMPVFGDAARNRTIEFQKANGLVADGIAGPRTLRALLRVYEFAAEEKNAIPNHYLARITTGESNDDPVAEGVADPEDEGVDQFHLPYWPGTTLAEAWDPRYEIGKAAAKLASLRVATGSWKGAVAAWNIGQTYAKQWVEADYPDSGGPTMGTDPKTGKPIYSFTRATNYFRYIASMPY